MWKIIENGHHVWSAPTWSCAQHLFDLACMRFTGIIYLVEPHGNIIMRKRVS